MGCHVYSLTSLGYLELDTFSDVTTEKSGVTLGKLSWRVLHTDKLNFAFIPFAPGHQN